MNDKPTSTRESSLTRRPPRLRRFRLLAACAVAVLAVGGWKTYRHFSPAPLDDSNVYATVQRGDVQDLVAATGSLQPRDYVDVGAQVSGQVTRIHVEVGTEVQEGELLAEIDAAQSTARVEANRATLRARQADLAAREVALTKAERDYQRQQNLMKEDATTTEAVENAETDVLSAHAQIDALKAQMQQIQASMRVEETNLGFTKIYAPMSGTVVSIDAKQGQTLNVNQAAPTILRIADLSTMRVQTLVSEADVSKLHAGVSAYFTTLGGQGRRWYGTLSKIEPTPTVTNNVVLYNALFEVPNTNKELLPQMTAQVFFVLAEARDVLVIPISAVTPQRSAADSRPGALAANAAGSASSAGSAHSGGSTPSVDGAPSAGSTPGAGAPGDQSERRAQRPRGERGAGRAGAVGATAGAPSAATVRVAQADGSIVERSVTIGATNRVQAQVLAGLVEGERVVAGIKQTAAPAASGTGERGLPGGFGGFGPR